jgi:hypothetical protein
MTLVDIFTTPVQQEQARGDVVRDIAIVPLRRAAINRPRRGQRYRMG